MPQVSESSCQELATLAAEVALKLGLRTGAQEFAQLLGGWQATPLHQLDLAGLEEDVGRWAVQGGWEVLGRPGWQGNALPPEAAA
jgi:hypothetical protein